MYLFRAVAIALVGICLPLTSALATPFTLTSPVNGGSQLPAGVTEVGGIVFHARGLNGATLTSQLSAGSLFSGFAGSNPQTIGTQAGLTPAILGQLGGGFSEIAIRMTLLDGDSSAGNFDFNDNFLQLNGFEFGAGVGAASNFSNINTDDTNNLGTASNGFILGFDDDDSGPLPGINTGFFHFTDAATLASVYASILGTSQLIIAVRDLDPGDNFYDFTAGVNGSLINVELGPTVSTEVPEPASLLVWGTMAGLALVGRRRMKASAA